jgi:hypothetical protein
MQDFGYFPDSLIIIDTKLRPIICFFNPVELSISKTKLSMKRHLIAQNSFSLCGHEFIAAFFHSYL